MVKAVIGEILRETHDLWDLEAFQREVRRRKAVERLYRKLYRLALSDRPDRAAIIELALSPEELWHFIYNTSSRAIDGYPIAFGQATSVVDAVRQFLAARHKHATDEFSLSVRSVRRLDTGFRVEGTYRAYSLGHYEFTASLDRAGRVVSYEERSKPDV